MRPQRPSVHPHTIDPASGLCPAISIHGLWLLCCLAAFVGCSRPSEQATAENPFGCDGCNIVIVTFDALRADHLGFYGYEKNTSPRLDAFASESYVFTDNLSQAGTTIPSFASLWTSKFPYTDNVMRHLPKFALDQAPVTLPEILRDAGYNTAAVIGHLYATARFGFGRGIDVVADDHAVDESAVETLDRALPVLDSLESPFFLWLHFRQPHSPYEARPEDFAEFYDGRLDLPLIYKVGRKQAQKHYRKRERSSKVWFMGKQHSLTKTMVKQYEAMYDGSIKLGDEQFGRLMDHLRATGVLDRTAVIVAADHGESMGEHERFDHNRLYYGIIHTPLMVRLPSAVHEVRTYPVMNVDVFPTVLDILGIPNEIQTRGRSLFDAERAGYLQYAEYENRKALKRGQYKLHVKVRSEEDLEIRLFDVAADPMEQHDLAKSKPQITSDLFEILGDLTTLVPDSETMKSLRALGYIE